MYKRQILPEVADVCERVIIIDKGKIVAQDTLENLSSNVNEITRLTLRIQGEEGNVRKTLREVRGVRYVEVLGVKEAGTVDFLVESERNQDVRADVFRAMVSLQRPCLLYTSRCV